jgi:hypothetical protein
VIPSTLLATTLPKEPVEVDEPLTPPPTKVSALDENSPLHEPLTVAESNELPPLPPAANEADVKCPPPTWMAPKEPVEVDDPLIFPLEVT